MSKRTFVCFALAAATILVATTLTAHAGREPVQASRITFTEVTPVCGHYLMGEYIVVHDDNAMAADEPCTTFYRLRPGQAAVVEVSFPCIPKQRAPVTMTTITTAPQSGGTTATRFLDLVEHQIAGDSEAHGVPRFDDHVTGR